MSFGEFATVAGGTAGIIVDGADPANQASSIYFTSLQATRQAPALFPRELSGRQRCQPS